ncbi:MAG: substrate-binding domain-containing protein [Burkholderiaceae bacterium]
MFAALVTSVVVAPVLAQSNAPALVVYAAGSLRAALTDVAVAFEASRPVRVAMTYGASGLLKDRIVAGESPAVFASANMEHPQALVAAGRAPAVHAFARNALCVLASPGFSLRGKALALRLLDADVRVGTSTPRADPSGEDAFELFDRIESSGAAGPGSAAALKAKALQLTGGPTSPSPPAGRNVYGDLVASGQADVFVTYCTNAALARREQVGLQVLAVPGGADVAARYGLALIGPPTADAQAYVQFLLGPQGQAILASHGFAAA